MKEIRSTDVYFRFRGQYRHLWEGSDRVRVVQGPCHRTYVGSGIVERCVGGLVEWERKRQVDVFRRARDSRLSLCMST